MKLLSIVSLILFTSFSTNAQSIAGIWNTGDYNTKIEITEVNGVAIGKVLSSDNAQAKIGNQVLKDFKQSNGGYKGQLYAAQKGEWYDAVIKENDDQLDITIKVGWVSKNIKWKKD